MNNSDLLEVMISRRVEEAQDIISLELVPAAGLRLPSFEAGAHVDVHVSSTVVRQYSLCNDPCETDRYVLGILREPESRGGSQAIHERFFEGCVVHIAPPRNNFKLVESAAHSVLAGGGIGVTPLLAMAWRLHALDASFELHYCARSLSRVAFRERLRNVPFADKVFFHLDDGAPGQKFNVDKVLSEVGMGRHLYVCGPSGFMSYVTTGAKRLGWSDNHVHLEYFGADIDVSGEVFTVVTARSGLTLRVPRDKTVAEILLQNGVDVPLSCEQGVCGTCLTPVLDGIPEHRDLYLTDEEKASNDQFTPCCSRAKTPILVLDI